MGCDQTDFLHQKILVSSFADKKSAHGPRV